MDNTGKVTLLVDSLAAPNGIAISGGPNFAVSNSVIEKNVVPMICFKGLLITAGFL